jgi:hypothetical protein
LALWVWTDYREIRSDATTIFFGCLGVAALGATFAASMYEGIKPDDERELRKKCNESPHS